MGAIAISERDEKKVAGLAKRLGAKSKAAVVRLALEELERQVEQRRKRAQIRAYVARYGELDRQENAVLTRAGVARRGR